LRKDSDLQRINFSGPVNWTGYGGVGMELLRQFLKKNSESSFFPIGECLPEDTIDVELCNLGISNAAAHWNCLDPSFRLWHEFDMFPRYGKVAYGMTFFEIDRLKPQAVIGLFSLEKIFVTSQWAKGVLENHGIYNGEVVKIGVSKEFYPRQRKDQGPYKFFNIGKLEIRKGHDILCELFNSAFEPEDDVELYIKWNNPFIANSTQKEFEKQYKSSKMGKKIHFVKASSKKDISNLITLGNCGIFPTRAEGFGLPILETIACGRPVITTNYSAPADFCNSTNSFLVNVDKTESAFDNLWFHGDGNWAHIGNSQKEAFIEHMRFCYKNRLDSNKGTEKTLSEYNWDSCSDRIFEVIERG
jgi:glycosyltransferase involved in cell wall biosynthesis